MHLEDTTSIWKVSCLYVNYIFFVKFIEKGIYIYDTK